MVRDFGVWGNPHDQGVHACCLILEIEPFTAQDKSSRSIRRHIGPVFPKWICQWITVFPSSLKEWTVSASPHTQKVWKSSDSSESHDLLLGSISWDIHGSLVNKDHTSQMLLPKNLGQGCWCLYFAAMLEGHARLALSKHAPGPWHSSQKCLPSPAVVGKEQTKVNTATEHTCSKPLSDQTKWAAGLPYESWVCLSPGGQHCCGESSLGLPV